jgi:hypothetical protein
VKFMKHFNGGARYKSFGTSGLNTSRNLLYEAVKVLSRSVEPRMMNCNCETTEARG